jgi:hypothetical protein
MAAMDIPPYKHYPILSRIEWHLSRSRYFAYGMDHVVSKARIRWYKWRRRKLIEPSSLLNYESKTFSQNGEDGILQEIFRRIGESDRFSVEFGFGDGTECCTRNLLVNHGWSGLLIDGSSACVENAKRVYRGVANVNIVQSLITAENILDIFKTHGVPKSPDLLVVDIDGNDYWVLQQILSAYRPRVIVCEYNARWEPATDWVMPYNPGHVWDGSAYFGASLAALFRLAKENGYALVCCDSRGVNAFFVRSDLIADRFPDVSLGVRLYLPPQYGRGYGHPLRFRRGLSRWRKWGILKKP